jgi:lambda repressor-like predicted transcriptional regulator
MDVRDDIIAHLEKNERSLAWMVRQIEGANYHTMYSVLVQKKIKLSDLTLSKINKTLQTKFKK